ncbi:unnamed protein product [marine sediment metagenome]|uniref:Beta-lactamase-related domain-containing protein n=1 Tax=marine sediment metagenome TaxID=412755 RepID=X1DRH4_9ZZZZ
MVNNRTDNIEIYKPVIQNLNSDIEENMKKHNIPGLTISLVTADKIIWIKGFGYKILS